MFNNYFPTKKNKHQKQVKARFEVDQDTSGRYLNTPVRSSRNILNLPSDVEDELRGNIHDMRHQFRSTNKRLQRLYADK